MYEIIFNPTAGRGRAARALERVRHFFEAQTLPYRVWPTEAPQHATRLVNALAEDASVLALGGDGTVHEVAAGCIGTERTLGVVPVGSGDDFAFALGLDRRDLEGALRTVTSGGVRVIDTGLVNGEPFVNAIGTGFDAEVAARVRTVPRLHKGLSAYLYAVIATLRTLSLAEVSVVVDDEEVFSGRSLLVSTQNGPRNGGGFLFAPTARLDDGSFEVMVAGAVGRLGTLTLVPRTIRGTHLSHPKVWSFRGRRVRVRWSSPKPAHLEGELVAPTLLYQIEHLSRSLRVFDRLDNP